MAPRLKQIMRPMHAVLGLGTPLTGVSSDDGPVGKPRRRKTQPGAQWYGTAAWQRRRWRCLVDAGFRCVRCGVVHADTSRLVADHRIPHRGDADLFWKGELDCLCDDCHNSAKQAEERQAQRGG